MGDRRGGYNDGEGLAIAIAGNDNLYVTGYFDDDVMFDSATLYSESRFGSDVFVAKLGTTAPSQTPQQVYVHSNPSGQGVKINNVLSSSRSTPCSFTIAPGNSFVVKITASGGASFNPDYLTVNYTGSPQTINFPPLEVAEPVTITSAPSGANVYIDGTLAGTTPFGTSVQPHTSFNVSVSKSGYTFEPEAQVVTWTGVINTSHGVNFIGTQSGSEVTVTLNGAEVGMGATIRIDCEIGGVHTQFSGADQSVLIIHPGETWIVTLEDPHYFIEGYWVYSPSSRIVTYSPENQTIDFSGVFHYYPSMVFISSEPSGSAVYIDNVYMGITPYDTYVNYGDPILVSVQLQGWNFDPPQQTVQWDYASQDVHFNGMQGYPGYTYIDPNNLPSEWVIEDSPYYVSAPIAIDFGENFLYEPGVEVFLDLGAEINIFGSMEATDVTFAPVQDTLMWDGLKFQGGNGTRNNSRLTGCTIKDAYVPITIKDCSPIISNVNITLTDTTVVIPHSGVLIYGNSSPNINDLILRNYAEGITIVDSTGVYQNTPTLTNIKVRNSSSSSRPLVGRKGISIIGTNAKLDNIRVDGYNIGIEVQNPQSIRVSTPTLSNVRVKNTSSSSRTDDVGVCLGSGIAGSLSDSHIEGARIGIKLMDGNQTIVKNNLLLNNEIGLQSAVTMDNIPIKYNSFALDQSFVTVHPTWSYRGLDFAMGSSHKVIGNTFYGYQKALYASNTSIEFTDNIVWGDALILDPFTLNAVQLINSYNDIRYVGGIYPGEGNINTDPMFANPATWDYHLHFNSPCIDTGNPNYTDTDGTVSDIGAYPYLHLADFQASAEFVTVGTEVVFENRSMGHSADESIIMWDLNNDEVIESTQRDFVHTFTEAGIYDLRLRTQTGNLLDEKTRTRVVVVQNEALQPPDGIDFSPTETGMVISWAPVTLNTQNQGLSHPVNHYLVYHSGTPNGAFDYLGYTSNGQTSMAVNHGNSHFYIVIGFDGTEERLQEYIRKNQRMRP